MRDTGAQSGCDKNSLLDVAFIAALCNESPQSLGAGAVFSTADEWSDFHRVHFWLGPGVTQVHIVIVCSTDVKVLERTAVDSIGATRCRL